MNNVITFPFQSHQVRVVDLNGSPWFVAADVCRALDLKSNPAKTGDGAFGHHLNKVGPDERKTLGKRDMPDISLFPGRVAWVAIISESGLYKLIMRSDKSQAHAFQDWVTQEVLPAIRKTGGYMLEGSNRAEIHEGHTTHMPVPTSFAEALRAHAQTLIDLAKSEEEKSKLSAEMARLTPKASAFESTFNDGKRIKLIEVARRLEGVNCMMIKSDLTKAGYLYKREARYYVKRTKSDNSFFEKHDDTYGKTDIFAGPKGVEVIDRLYREGKLTMRVGYAKAS